MILLDTNVLVRVANRTDPNCQVAQSAIDGFRAQGERIAVVPQNLYEFWAVATRAAGLPPSGQNGLGMTPSEASRWIRFFRRSFALLPDRVEMAGRWHALVGGYGVTGFKSHDARLVAAMHCYGIERLLTFNMRDFRVFPITCIDPSE